MKKKLLLMLLVAVLLAALVPAMTTTADAKAHYPYADHGDVLYARMDNGQFWILGDHYRQYDLYPNYVTWSGTSAPLSQMTEWGNWRISGDLDTTDKFYFHKDTSFFTPALFNLDLCLAGHTLSGATLENPYYHMSVNGCGCTGSVSNVTIEFGNWSFENVTGDIRINQNCSVSVKPGLVVYNDGGRVSVDVTGLTSDVLVGYGDISGFSWTADDVEENADAYEFYEANGGIYVREKVVNTTEEPDTTVVGGNNSSCAHVWVSATMVYYDGHYAYCFNCGAARTVPHFFDVFINARSGGIIYGMDNYPVGDEMAVENGDLLFMYCVMCMYDGDYQLPFWTRHEEVYRTYVYTNDSVVADGEPVEASELVSYLYYIPADKSYSETAENKSALTFYTVKWTDETGATTLDEAPSEPGSYRLYLRVAWHGDWSTRNGSGIIDTSRYTFYVPFSIVKAEQDPLTLSLAPDAGFLEVDNTYQAQATGGSGSGETTWEIVSGNEYATIDQNGVVTVTSRVEDASITVQATKAGDETYEPTSTRKTLAIEEGVYDEKLLGITAQVLTYNGKAQTPELTYISTRDSQGAEFKYEYSTDGGETWSTEIPTFTYPNKDSDKVTTVQFRTSSDNYGYAYGSFDVTMKLAETPDVTITAENLTFVEGSQTPKLTYSGTETSDGTDLVFSYSTDGGSTWSTDVPTFRDSGRNGNSRSYAVKFRAGADYYSTVEGEFTVVVDPCDFGDLDLRMRQSGTLTYNGQEQSPVFSRPATYTCCGYGGWQGMGIPYIWKIYDNDTKKYSDDWVTTLPTETEADTYLVWYEISHDNNWHHVNFSPSEKDENGVSIGFCYWTIQPADLTLEVEQDDVLTYSGLAQAPALTAPEDTELGSNAITYTYSLTEAEGGKGYGAMPTFTDPGSYTVYYYATAANHNPTSGSFAVRVADADITGELKQSGTITYDGQPHTPAVDVTGLTLQGGQQPTITYSTEENGEYSSQIPSFTAPGEHTVYYKVTADNHTPFSGSFKVVVAKGGMDVTITADDLDYTGSSLTPTPRITGSLTDGSGYTVTYSTAEDGTYSADVPSFLNMGRHTVWYKVTADNGCYEAQEARSFAFTIKGSELEVTIAQSGTMHYIAQAQTPALTRTVTKYTDDTSTTADEKDSVSYRYTTTTVTETPDADSSWQDTVPTVTNKGTYTFGFEATLANHTPYYGTFTVTVGDGVFVDKDGDGQVDEGEYVPAEDEDEDGIYEDDTHIYIPVDTDGDSDVDSYAPVSKDTEKDEDNGYTEEGQKYIPVDKDGDGTLDYKEDENRDYFVPVEGDKGADGSYKDDSGKTYIPVDNNGDGKTDNYVKAEDQDNDGIYTGTDTGKDYLPVDKDGDGDADYYVPIKTRPEDGKAPEYTDESGKTYVPVDNDGDGDTDSYVKAEDPDGDGWPNGTETGKEYVPVDNDGDGVPDVYVPDGVITDPNGDGLYTPEGKDEPVYVPVDTDDDGDRDDGFEQVTEKDDGTYEDGDEGDDVYVPVDDDEDDGIDDYVDKDTITDPDGDGIYEDEEGNKYVPEDFNGDGEEEGFEKVTDPDDDGVYEDNDGDESIPDQNGDKEAEKDEDDDGVFEDENGEKYIPDQDSDKEPETDSDDNGVFEGSRNDDDEDETNDNFYFPVTDPTTGETEYYPVTADGNALPPVIKSSGGTKFYGTSTVTITCRTPGVTIYYTTDGATEPDAVNGTEYTEGFKISETTTIKAVAISSVAEIGDSAVAEATFTRSSGGFGGGSSASDICEQFPDVNTDLWYHDAIHHALTEKLMKGYDTGLFGTLDNLNRAMLVQILYRLEGEPAFTTDKSFSDVGDTWYTRAVLWAAENGIVEGYDGKFSPNADITREQLATILYRYARYKGIDVSARTGLSSFADGGKTSSWAKDAAEWAVGAGVIGGKDDGYGRITLDPTGTATRAEVAQMLLNFWEKILGR